MKKFSSFFVVLMLMLASFTAGVEYPRGDVNYDGRVGMDDLACLINYLLTDSWPEDPVTPPDTHEWVDLGLPSGTLWATCNIGANAPEEYGDYFAWGETEPKEHYKWLTYKWCNDTAHTLTKYCTVSDYGYNGFVDNKAELDPEDDAAYVNWGPYWRMPTKDQCRELRQKCYWTQSTVNGVYGDLITGPNGNTIFLPAAGIRSWNTVYFAGEEGYYWGRELNSLAPDFAPFLRGGDYERFFGFSVRAVRVSQE